MNVWEAIRTKRMVRTFRNEPLPPEQLERIVDAGRHAASSKNQQRWDFIAVQDRERLRALATGLSVEAVAMVFSESSEVKLSPAR